jgi:4-amino-4-deoxy-L-arabinose transferase-like glycosyltransferase
VSRRIGLLLFAGAFLLRLAYCAASFKLRGVPPTDVFDPWDTLAAAVLRGEGLRCELFGLTWYSHRPPVFPLLVAGVRFLFGTGMWPIYLMQSALGAATAVLVWRIGARVYSERAGLWAGIAFTFWPFSVVWTAGVQPEVLGAMLLATCLWALVGERMWLAGLLAGLLALTRSNYLFLAPLFALWLLVGRQGRRALPMLAVWALTLIPWGVRNTVVHGQWMLTSSDGAMAFLFYNDKEMIRRQLAGESERVEPMSLTYGRIFEDLKKMNEPQQTAAMYRGGMDNVKQVPAQYARVVVQRLWLLWNPVPDTGGGRTRLVVGIPLVLAHLGALWGFVVLWRERRQRMLGVLLLGLAAFATSVILVRGVSRYKATIEPAVVLLAIAGARDAVGRLARRRVAQSRTLDSATAA